MAKKIETRPSTGHINPFGLRLQPELKARLENAAERAGRSLNAEIVDRLTASLNADLMPLETDADFIDAFARNRVGMSQALKEKVTEIEAVVKEEQLHSDPLFHQLDRLGEAVYKVDRYQDLVQKSLDTALLRLRIAWRQLYLARRRAAGDSATSDGDEGLPTNEAP